MSSIDIFIDASRRSAFCGVLISVDCVNYRVSRRFLAFHRVIFYICHKMAIHIKDADDLKTRLSEAGEKLVVIDFMATWCGPCKMIGPKLEELANEMADSIVVLKVDVDQCEDVAAEYNINAMPTFVFLKSSQKLEEFSGANVDKLKNTILKLK